MLQDNDVPCYLTPGEGEKLPRLYGRRSPNESFDLGWSALNQDMSHAQLFLTIHETGPHEASWHFHTIYHEVGEAGEEDAALVVNRTLGALRGEYRPDKSVLSLGGPIVLELVGTFVAGSFILPFMKAIADAAGKDTYAALKRGMSALMKLGKKSSDHPDDEGITRIADPHTGTTLMFPSSTPVAEVIEAMTVIRSDSGALTLAWNAESKQFGEVSDVK